MAENIEELRQEVAENQKFDVDAYQFPSTIPVALQEELKRDAKLSQKVQLLVLELAEKMQSGEVTMTWEDLQNAINQLALENQGTEYGLPLPSLSAMDRPMVVAKGVPLRHVIEQSARTELEEELSHKIKVRNSWSKLGDAEIAIIETEEGPFALPRYHAGWRLQKLLDTSMIRSGTTQTAEAELRAMDSLKLRINKRQWESYVLSGMFPERSEKSDLHYFFRKGYPTIVASYHEGIKPGFQEGHVLACLCLHPIGYYQQTYCGLMCPTDEVICHLLLMRADERKYWSQCGQWSAHDPRSGI
jgi:hypothetical protein